MTVTRHSYAESRRAVAREIQCERDQCTLNAHCLEPVSNQFECGLILVQCEHTLSVNLLYRILIGCVFCTAQ